MFGTTYIESLAQAHRIPARTAPHADSALIAAQQQRVRKRRDERGVGVGQVLVCVGVLQQGEVGELVAGLLG